MHDLVIRGGTVVDGTGAPAREADVALDGARVTAVGSNVGAGRRELDARGKLVTPGWVDIHTHYDGQVTWDPYLTPTGWNGVTTVVMGNCGVGFAPVRPDQHEYLIQLMEGVEDIPGTALAEGIRWSWESFPEYLDAIERLPHGLDVAAQVPHGALRTYVMGERGAKNEKATREDVAEMARLVREALAAGALGFSSSRTILHRAKDGEVVPGTTAGDEELFGIGRAMGAAGHGVFEVASDLAPEAEELRWMSALSRETGRPVTFACLQTPADPEQWRRLLRACEADKAAGGRIVPQVAQRPAGLLLSFETLVSPFLFRPAFQALLALPPHELRERLRRPEVRAAVCRDAPDTANLPGVATLIASAWHMIFPLGDPPDYEPGPEKSVAAIAARTGRTPDEVAYDLLLERDCKAMLYLPLLGYADGNFDALREMMVHPQAVFGLSDGGAHCGVICDASAPTFLLTHWVRDRTRGARIPLEHAVAGQTRRTAELYGLFDRGALVPGLKADVNVIDLARLHIRAPEVVYDLPASARRLVQRIDGYDYTIVSGQVTYERGNVTGALPGKLLRGPQRA
jgi:N-acyl-D-aspartate/D-glutamate deacylase